MPSPGVLKTTPQGTGEAEACQVLMPWAAEKGSGGSQAEVLTQTESTVLSKPHAKRAEKTL